MSTQMNAKILLMYFFLLVFEFDMRRDLVTFLNRKGNNENSTYFLLRIAGIGRTPVPLRSRRLPSSGLPSGMLPSGLLPSGLMPSGSLSP